MTRAMHLQQVKNRRGLPARAGRSQQHRVSRMQKEYDEAKSYFASLTPEQQRTALAHEGDDLPPPDDPVDGLDAAFWMEAFTPKRLNRPEPPLVFLEQFPTPESRNDTGPWIGVTLGLILALVACAFAAYWWA